MDQVCVNEEVYQKIKAYIVFREMCVVDPIFMNFYEQLHNEYAKDESHAYERKELDEIYLMRVLRYQRDGVISSNFALEITTSDAYLDCVAEEDWTPKVDAHIRRFERQFNNRKENEFSISREAVIA